MYLYHLFLHNNAVFRYKLCGKLFQTKLSTLNYEKSSLSNKNRKIDGNASKFLGQELAIFIYS